MSSPAHDIPYYQFLQSRLISMFPYVSCHQDNHGTYSIQFESLLVDVCSFFDSMCQEFIRDRHPSHPFRQVAEVNNSAKKLAGDSHFDMKDYRTLLEAEFKFSDRGVNLNADEDHWHFNPMMTDVENLSRTPDSPIHPFEGWEEGKSLSWWTAYTDLKHNRLINRKCASLKNVLHGMAAVFILLTLKQAEPFHSGEVGADLYQLFIPLYGTFIGRIMPGVFRWSGLDTPAV